MRRSRQDFKLSRLIRFVCYCMLGPAALSAVVQNSSYRIELLKDGAVEIQAGSARRQFAPVFAILIADRDPQLSYELSKEEAYVVPSWKRRESDRTRESGRTMDLFEADMHMETVRADGAALLNGTVRWHFPEQKAGNLRAELTLPQSGDPRIRFWFTPNPSPPCTCSIFMNVLRPVRLLTTTPLPVVPPAKRSFRPNVLNTA